MRCSTASLLFSCFYFLACSGSDSGADGAAPGSGGAAGIVGVAGGPTAGASGKAAGGAGGAPKGGAAGATSGGTAGAAGGASKGGAGGAAGASGVSGAGAAGAAGAAGSAGASGAAGKAGSAGAGGAPYPPTICAGLTLDGKNARAVAPWISPYDVAGALTVEAWVEPLSVPLGAAAPIVVHWDGATDTASYGLFLQPSGKASFFVSSNGAATVGVSSAKPLKTGVMQHVAGVLDSAGKALRLYVDGTLDATLPIAFSTPMAVVGAPLSLGNFASPTPAQPSLFGTIASVRAAATVRYNAAFLPEYPLPADLSTFAAFKLDVELSSKVLDSSSSSNAAQLLGGAKVGKPASCSTGTGGSAGSAGSGGAGSGGKAGSGGGGGTAGGGTSGGGGAGGGGAGGSAGGSGASGAGGGGAGGVSGSAGAGG